MASIHGITLGSVIIVTLMPFTSIKFMSMNSFDVISKLGSFTVMKMDAQKQGDKTGFSLYKNMNLERN